MFQGTFILPKTWGCFLPCHFFVGFFFLTSKVKIPEISAGGIPAWFETWQALSSSLLPLVDNGGKWILENAKTSLA